MKVKAGNGIVDVIRLAYAAGKPVMLEGRHGVGKSQLIEQAAKELGIECIVRDLSLMEPSDLTGLPYKDPVNGRTKFSPPSFLPDSGKGLLVFEELNRAEKCMMAPCLQLLTARTLNDYHLPKGYLCICATNPSTDGYETQEMDAALLSRFIRVTVEADVKEFLKWGDSNGVHPAITRFLRNTVDIFTVPESNPRAWTWASDILHTHEKAGNGCEGLLTVTISGLVGDALGTAFVQSYLNGEEPILANAIIREYDRNQGTVQQWATMKKTDLLNASAHNVLVALQNVDVCAEVGNSESMRTNLAAFISDLPAEIGKRLMKAAKQAGALP